MLLLAIAILEQPGEPYVGDPSFYHCGSDRCADRQGIEGHVGVCVGMIVVVELSQYASCL